MKTRAKTMRKLSLLLLAAMALAAVLAVPPAQADTTFVVDRADDDASATACTAAAANDCSLRGAIMAANAASGADAVEVPAGNYTLTINGPREQASATGDLDITQSLTIEGAGAGSTTVAGGAGFDDRIFHNQPQASTSISGLTITGGAVSGNDGYFSGGGILNGDEGGRFLRGAVLTVSESTISGNKTVGDGGGIYSVNADLTVRGSTISGNTSFSGGGIHSFDNSGDHGQKLTIENSTISGNTTRGYGGGVFSHHTTLTVSGSTISENTSGDAGGISHGGADATVSESAITGNTATKYGGGGIYNYSAANLTVSDTTVSGNTATKYGGGIYNYAGNLTVSDATVRSNTTTDDGGGIYTDNFHGGSLSVERSTISANTAGSDGGGIYALTYSYAHGLIKNSIISNSTISSNTATDGFGGGIYNNQGITEIGHSTVTANTAPAGKGSGVASMGDSLDYTEEGTRTEVYSSIISGNENTDVDFAEDPDWGDQFANTTFASGGHNVMGDGNAAAAFDKGGDQRGVSGPLLGSLADNGGPTRTHALLAGSPAIDAVPSGTNGCGTVVTADQRGVQRPQGGACDAGSFEKEQVPYAFTGFYSPVDNPDVATNRAKAGSSIPVKFSLGGDMGLDIFATGTDANNNTFSYPTSSAMRCDSTDPVDAIEETVAAGGGGLQYDPTLDRYTYVWKTNKAWAGTCRQLVVKLDDGTYHRANFKFVR